MISGDDKELGVVIPLNCKENGASKGSEGTNSRVLKYITAFAGKVKYSDIENMLLFETVPVYPNTVDGHTKTCNVPRGTNNSSSNPEIVNTASFGKKAV
jgi:hypothetical protein